MSSKITKKDIKEMGGNGLCGCPDDMGKNVKLIDEYQENCFEVLEGKVSKRITATAVTVTTVAITEISYKTSIYL